MLIVVFIRCSCVQFKTITIIMVDSTIWNYLNFKFHKQLIGDCEKKPQTMWCTTVDAIAVKKQILWLRYPFTKSIRRWVFFRLDDTTVANIISFGSVITLWFIQLMIYGRTVSNVMSSLEYIILKSLCTCDWRRLNMYIECHSQNDINELFAYLRTQAHINTHKQ